VVFEDEILLYDLNVGVAGDLLDYFVFVVKEEEEAGREASGVSWKPCDQQTRFNLSSDTSITSSLNMTSVGV